MTQKNSSEVEWLKIKLYYNIIKYKATLWS